jgi:acetyltransferase-like isoleucine patch superfamily enzyme
MRFLAFLFGWWVYHPYSAFVAMVLRAKGVRVGRNLYIQGVPYLKLRGKAANVSIGDNVAIYGDIDLRNRENGKIIIESNVSFDLGCRLVAANDATLTFREGADIGGYCIFNCGADVTVGQHVLMASYCYVQSSNHGIRRSELIKRQPHSYGDIVIGRDVWVAGHASILAGVTIAEGAVVGAKAVVASDVAPYAICAGIPARVIGERQN